MKKSDDGVAFWAATTQPSWSHTVEALKALDSRWRSYEASEVDQYISPVDDMLDSDDSKNHYFDIGRSALHIISEAILLSGRAHFDRILDLPCGGGRITRHLVKFFPDAKIYVDDIVAEKREAVRDQFALEFALCARDFRGALDIQFDMIFVGSLFTHLNHTMFRDALNYLIASLSPGGLLIMTTHGRLAATWAASEQRKLGKSRRPKSLLDTLRRKPRPVAVEDVLEAIEGSYVETGFGYTEYRAFTQAYGKSYGATFVTPSWLMQLVQSRADATILGFKERGFANHQDVLTLQKLAR
jgi:SAM-dependent methyltransferase